MPETLVGVLIQATAVTTLVISGALLLRQIFYRDVILRYRMMVVALASCLAAIVAPLVFARFVPQIAVQPPVFETVVSDTEGAPANPSSTVEYPRLASPSVRLTNINRARVALAACTGLTNWSTELVFLALAVYAAGVALGRIVAADSNWQDDTIPAALRCG